MSTKHEYQEEPHPRRVRTVLSSRHPMTSELLSQLEPSEIEELERIAKGEFPESSRADRVNALTALARLGSSGVGDVLRGILEDEEADADLRAAAATRLSYLPPEQAEEALIAALRTRDEAVRVRAIQSLGRIGGEKALEGLDGTSVDADYAQKQLAFAKALISYRLGLDRDTLTFVEGVHREAKPDEQLLTLTFTQVGAERVKQCLQLMEGSSYGIDVAEDFGFEVNVRRATWMLLFNLKAVENKTLAPLAKQKMLLGLLTRWIKETGTYAIQYIVFAHPADPEKVELMVARTDGEIVYSGHGGVEDDVLGFSISDIERPGTAPTRVAGELGPEGIELAVSLPFPRREGKRLAGELTDDMLRKLRE